MHLLLTRPLEDAQQSARALSALGHETTIIPLLEITPLPTAIDLTPYQAVLITSANGIRALATQTQNRDTPVLCVGDASAREAQALGFQYVTHANGDVQALAAHTVQSLAPQNGPLIHIAGENRAGNLQADLAARGFNVDRTALYRAQLAQNLPQIDWDTLDGALFYSPRTARHFAKLVAEAGLADHCKTMVAYGLSQAVADALASLPFKAVKIATCPVQDALFDQLGFAQLGTA